MQTWIYIPLSSKQMKSNITAHSLICFPEYFSVLVRTALPHSSTAACSSPEWTCHSPTSPLLMGHRASSVLHDLPWELHTFVQAPIPFPLFSQGSSSLFPRGNWGCQVGSPPASYLPDLHTDLGLQPSFGVFCRRARPLCLPTRPPVLTQGFPTLILSGVFPNPSFSLAVSKLT